MTQGIWEEIQPQLQGRLKRVSKLSLGFGDEIWAVSGEQEARHFLRARDRVLEIVQPSDSPHPALNDIEFIAFGCCEDDFIIKIKGEFSVGNWESPSMSGIRPAQVNQIVVRSLEWAFWININRDSALPLGRSSLTCRRFSLFYSLQRRILQGRVAQSAEEDRQTTHEDNDVFAV